MTTADRLRHVVRATPERVEEALSALLAAGPAASSRFARQAESARIALDRMWCLADEFGRYRMAVLAVPSLGRTAMLLASHPRSSDEAQALGRAIAAAAEGCGDACDIAQALLEPSRPLDLEAFEAGGLQRMATLDYLERHLPRSGVLEPTPVPDGWTIGPVADPRVLSGDDPRALGEQCRAEIAAVLDESYLDTRDCPGLAGMRRTLDVLDGHFGLGGKPRFWFVARRDGVARGVCLLNGSTDGGSAELVYLGLARDARGTGIARALLTAGLHACSAARVSTVSLAVDAGNEPARRLYESHGFRRTSSRVALVRRLARHEAR
ncbi:MAG: GNAT family N-acetyltransferase [Phycisphaerales bacterium]|jgi:ribosomal protein S18 acetylase RimI-like enzyme